MDRFNRTLINTAMLHNMEEVTTRMSQAKTMTLWHTAFHAKLPSLTGSRMCLSQAYHL